MNNLFWFLYTFFRNRVCVCDFIAQVKNKFNKKIE